MAITKLNRYSLPTTLDLSAKTLTLPSASVTAHVTQTDLQPIKSDISALALREATNESSAAFNLPNQFIETFTDDTNLGTQTDGDRDSGSTFTQGTLVDEGTWGTNKKILAFHDLDISGQPSGTDMCYKITTHNQSAGSKETKIHATSIGWK